MRVKISKLPAPHYAFAVTEKIQPFLEDAVAEQFAKLIRKHSRKIAKQLLLDFKLDMTELVVDESLEREFRTEIRKKESWEK